MSRLGLPLLVALTLSVACDTPTPSEVVELRIAFAPCLGPVEPEADAMEAPALCRAHLDAHIASEGDAPGVHGCLLLKSAGVPIERMGFRWRDRRLLPVPGSKNTLGTQIDHALFFLFDSLRPGCEDVTRGTRCSAETGCLLILEQEDIDLIDPEAQLDFRRLSECQVRSNGSLDLKPCTGCCELGESEVEGCGFCGQRSRICAGGCRWADWGPCSGAGPCSPDGDGRGGGVHNLGLECTAGEDLCGEFIQGCTPDCQWAAPECGNTGPCGPGMEPTDAMQCEDQRECVPGALESQRCGAQEGACSAGVQQRQCGRNCQYGEWGECAGSIGPMDEICGNGIDEDCDGADLVNPDQYDAVRPNNECADATDLVSGDFAGITRIVGSIHGGRDYDYYQVPPPFFTTLNKSAAFPFTFTVPAGGYRMIIFGTEADCRRRDTLYQHDVVGPAVEHLTLTDSGAGARSAYLVKVRSLDGTYNCDESYSIESGHIESVELAPPAP